LAWLKSTKMRRPRSSFHQSTVTASGIRRALSPRRDDGVADVEELVRRLDGAEHVDAAIAAGLQPRFEPGLAQHVAQHRSDGRGIREIGAGCGSRSMRSSTGLSVSAASEAHGWNTTVFICTAQTMAAASSSTT
jgi:hypothetical protein